MTVIVGMNNVKIIILTKPISYQKQKKQSMNMCPILFRQALIYKDAKGYLWLQLCVYLHFMCIICNCFGNDMNMFVKQ